MTVCGPAAPSICAVWQRRSRCLSLQAPASAQVIAVKGSVSTTEGIVALLGGVSWFRNGTPQFKDPTPLTGNSSEIRKQTETAAILMTEGKRKQIIHMGGKPPIVHNDGLGKCYMYKITFCLQFINMRGIIYWQDLDSLEYLHTTKMIKSKFAREYLIPLIKSNTSNI